MPKLVITDVDSRFNGEYEDVDIGDLTNRELHFIFTLCEVEPVDVFRRLMRGHSGLIVALTAVVMQRLGKQPDLDAFWDAPAGLIKFDWSAEKEEAAAAIPPPMPPDGGEETSSDEETDVGRGTSG